MLSQQRIVLKKLIIFFGCLLFFPFAYAELPDTVVKIKPSIVGIGTFLQTRRPPAKLMGTGFAVGDGRHVVTNAHVIPDLIDEENKEFLCIFVGTGEDAKIRPAKLISKDVVHDLALLKISGDVLPSMSLAYSKDVREGALYAFTGFPIGAVLGVYPVTHRGIVSAISPIVIPVSSSKELDVQMIKRLRNPYDVFQLDATAYPGNSGSPLYDPETGKVIGVINKVFVKETKEHVLDKPSGITYAIPVKHVRELLQEAKIAF